MVDLSGFVGSGQAARRLGVSAEYVRSLTKAGKLPFVSSPNGRLILERDVEALAAERRQRADRRRTSRAAGAA